MPSESDKWGWKHVSVFGGFNKGSGTKKWKCNHCNLRYNGSYSRVRAHLLGFTGVGVKSCPAIDRSLREALQLLEGQRVSRKKKRVSGIREPVKRNSVSKTLTKEDVDDTVARFFYAGGLKVNSVNSPYFHEMAKAIANFGPGYEPPSVDKISDTFLRKEKAKMEKTMALIRESWPHTACTILCDNCINVFVSSPRGIMFLKNVDISVCNGEGLALTDVLIDSIVEVGPTNVIQIISCLGYASECYESDILSKFPHVFWSPCTSHSVRTLMEGIAEMDWIKPIVLCAKGIEKCITSYQSSSLTSFTQNLKERFDPISATLAPSYFTVQGIFELKQALQEVVVSEEWKEWKLTSIEEEITITNIESAILGDDFWEKALLFLELFKPFITLLSTLNNITNKSVMGDVYFWRFQALEAVTNNGIDEIAVNELAMLIESRWETLFSPLHAAGYILNPRYFGRGQIRDKTVMRGWKASLERYEHDSGARRVLREQLSSYCRLEGSFGEEDAMDSRDKMDPVAWWENFGFETPQLQTLAIKILSQVSSVPMCQESSLDYGFEYQERGNRLGVQIEEDLLFVRNNLKLQSIRNGNMNFFPSGSRNGNSRI